MARTCEQALEAPLRPRDTYACWRHDTLNGSPLWALRHRRQPPRRAGRSRGPPQDLHPPRHGPYPRPFHRRPGRRHCVQVLHRARQVLVPVRHGLPARLAVVRRTGPVPMVRVVRVRWLSGHMGVLPPRPPATMPHHRMQHRRHREPIHQDHQSQRGQVSSVMGVQQGGSAREGGGEGRSSPSCLRADGQDGFPRELPHAQHPAAWQCHTRCMALDAAHWINLP